MKAGPEERCREAFRRNDATLLREVLREHPELKARVNDPIGPFDSPLVACVRTREMLDVLLEAGADINARSRWWAGSFGLLDHASPDLAKYAIERGATLTVHAAARLGWLDQLQTMITRDPGVMQERGGDGQTPLHFAGTVEVARFLLDHGAEIDARDIDHESTPAQYMIGDRQNIVRFLIQRGCKTDIFMAAALGDANLARKHLQTEPECIALRVNEQCFPMRNPHAGGTIYNWTLGWHLSPHQVAKKFGHEDVYELLMEHSPASVRLLNACWTGDEAAVESILRTDPAAARNLSQADHQQIAHAARNNNAEAVRLMLKAGFPVEARGQHGATPLYWAAWHGNAAMVREILGHRPQLEVSGLDFPGSALDWAVHGSENGWQKETGDYGATVEALLNGGATPPEKLAGSTAVRDAFERCLRSLH